MMKNFKWSFSKNYPEQPETIIQDRFAEKLSIFENVTFLSHLCPSKDKNNGFEENPGAVDITGGEKEIRTLGTG